MRREEVEEEEVRQVKEGKVGETEGTGSRRSKGC